MLQVCIPFWEEPYSSGASCSEDDFLMAVLFGRKREAEAEVDGQHCNRSQANAAGSVGVGSGARGVMMMAVTTH